MASIMRSSLFHKKSKASLKSTDSSDDQKHTRTRSSSSSISGASTTSSTETGTTRRHKLNPLSLHPPMRFNASPDLTPVYDLARYEADTERESRFFHQVPTYAHDHIQDLSEFSPVKGENCYFASPTYDEEWPLKNWQVIAPGLSPCSSTSTSVASSPTLPEAPRRRNADWMDDRDVFIKRGEWKRRGIVFGLHDEDEMWQEKHFELPLPSE